MSINNLVTLFQYPSGTTLSFLFTSTPLCLLIIRPVDSTRLIFLYSCVCPKSTGLGTFMGLFIVLAINFRKDFYASHVSLEKRLFSSRLCFFKTVTRYCLFSKPFLVAITPSQVMAVRESNLTSLLPTTMRSTLPLLSELGGGQILAGYYVLSANLLTVSVSSAGQARQTISASAWSLWPPYPCHSDYQQSFHISLNQHQIRAPQLASHSQPSSGVGPG